MTIKNSRFDYIAFVQSLQVLALLCVSIGYCSREYFSFHSALRGLFCFLSSCCELLASVLSLKALVFVSCTRRCRRYSSAGVIPRVPYKCLVLLCISAASVVLTTIHLGTSVLSHLKHFDLFVIAPSPGLCDHCTFLGEYVPCFFPLGFLRVFIPGSHT